MDGRSSLNIDIVSYALKIDKCKCLNGVTCVFFMSKKHI